MRGRICTGNKNRERESYMEAGESEGCGRETDTERKRERKMGDG